jgi:hypothetical protein
MPDACQVFLCVGPGGPHDLRLRFEEIEVMGLNYDRDDESEPDDNDTGSEYGSTDEHAGESDLGAWASYYCLLRRTAAAVDRVY